MRLILAICLAACVTLVTPACSKNVVASTPGAVNTFDANAYNALVSARAAISQAETQYLAGTPNATLKNIINTAVASYNAVAPAYILYHQALVAGGAPDPTTLQTQVTQLVANVAALITQIGGTKAPAVPVTAMPPAAVTAVP